jgi:uncharacterized membrane protein
VIDWLLPTLGNVFAVGALGVGTSLALRTLTWRSILLATMCAYLVACAVLLALGDARLAFDGDWGWALLSGVILVTVFVSMNVALGKGEASKVVAFSAAYPVITLLLGAVALGETVSAQNWTGTLMVIVGVGIISTADPHLTEAPRSWGWLPPTLIFTAGLGAIGVTSRLALETLAWQDLIVWATVTYTAAAAVAVVVERARGEVLLRTNGWALVTGVLAVAALATLYIALGEGEASTVIPVSSAFPIVTLLLAWALLGERLTMRRSFGTAVVVGGVLVITAL